MAKTLLIPLGGGGGGGDMSNYYTKQQIDAMLQGVQSIQGFQGIAGENGTQGIQGIKGSDGTNGVDGLQGIQGIAGQNGTNGVDGQQGIQGIKGSDGTNGTQGIQGIAGQDGTNGADGLQGIQGIAGQDGTNGVDGLQGIQGTMGIQGPAGSGGGTSRYDISTKSQEELADFYQNWETVMASNDVYVGIYPVTSVIPEYTVEEYTAVLLEFNISFGLEDDETTETPIVNGVVGAYYILPNGMGGLYGTDVPLASKDYVDAVVAGIQAIQGIQGTAGTNGADGLQGIQGIMGIQGAAGSGGGGASRYDISIKSQAELAEFYQNWETVMASNDVYFGVYPVVSVNPEYTQMDIGGVTVDVMLVEYNPQFGFVDDMPDIVSGKVGAWYILPNGMGGDYTAEMLFASKDYVDNGLQGKQDQLTAGEGISIQGTTISATGGGGSAWYGTQAQFDALQNPSADVDYFISDQIKWDEIKGRPDIGSLATKNELNEEVIALDELVGTKENKIQYMSMQGFQSIQPQEGYVYAIEGNTVEMVFTFTDSTQATYNVVID